MSLKPIESNSIPEDTARVARAAFPNSNIYLKVRDRPGTLYQDDLFAALFPTRGRPTESHARLALVTIFQFAKGLSDGAAADAVRSRIDWKYALGLELTDPGFDASVSTEFRPLLKLAEQDRIAAKSRLLIGTPLVTYPKKITDSVQPIYHDNK